MGAVILSGCLARTQIEGRLLTLADVYDGLTTKLPYHPARPREEVISFLQYYAGKHFDPELVQVFIQVVRSQAA
jgi:putative two-component system response regulator